MASNQTANFGLNQWSAEDKVLREEFNADNQKIEAALGSIPKVATGSYVGTGTSGADKPSSMNFEFQPLMVVITQDSTTSARSGFLLIQGQSTSAGIGSVSSTSAALEVHITWAGKGLSWYSNEGPNEQMNVSGETYYYFALGR